MAASMSTTNRSLLIQILTWAFFIIGFTFLVVRQATRYALRGAFRIEDQLVVAAVTFFLAQSIAVSVAAAKGLGKPHSSLQQSDVTVYQKADYAATCLFLASLCTAKVSTICFARTLNASIGQQRWLRFLGWFIWLWAGIGIVTWLFGCTIPRTWDHIEKRNHCVDLSAVWSYIQLGNMLTDTTIVLLQIWVMWRLHMTRGSKFLLLAVFSLRLLNVPTAIIQLLTYRNANRSVDITLQSWLPITLNQINLFVSLTATCMPHIKWFLECLENGLVENRVREGGRNSSARQRRRTVGTELRVTGIETRIWVGGDEESEGSESERGRGSEGSEGGIIHAK
ncbi:hypothetical protein K458DRAFT_490995 [Lentithecium fluviatile CBS 122367]|uniref:Rhodopsin domain-containing protein n=1 Tax=Lentithecium fluviatile CBS 122367 TaxID=1168545 RepID=A0A6G1IL62_9PLEO|nr:hypothetical protein K458DRAFT_490995 [Lentithecium fluviatile CBS 122367]